LILSIKYPNCSCSSFAKEAMLNINAFFEFKQRKRRTYSFQLAQLIYHSQHLNEYHISAQNIIMDSHRKKSTMSSDDPVSNSKFLDV
jgi:hypothetical protein